MLNNSVISGLANRAAEDFRRDGWVVDEVGNFPENRGRLPFSTAFFRPGEAAEEAAAREFASRFGMHAEARGADIASRPPGLVVILAKDYDLK